MGWIWEIPICLAEIACLLAGSFALLDGRWEKATAFFCAAILAHLNIINPSVALRVGTATPTTDGEPGKKQS